MYINTHTHIYTYTHIYKASQVAEWVKNLPACNAGDTRDMGSITGAGRCPEGGDGNPLQYSCLENPTDRGAWRARVNTVARTWTRQETERAHTHTNFLSQKNVAQSLDVYINRALKKTQKKNKCYFLL